MKLAAAAFVLAAALAAASVLADRRESEAGLVSKAALAGQMRAKLIRKASESRVEEEKCARELDSVIARFDVLSRGLGRVEREFDLIADFASVSSAESELAAEIARMKARMDEMKTGFNSACVEAARAEELLAASNGSDRGQASARLAQARRKTELIQSQIAQAENDAAHASRVLSER